MSDPSRLAGMQRYGIQFKQAYGISLPDLRNLHKTYKKLPHRHELALSLWDTGIHEAMILAGMIADPKKFTPHDMDRWVNSLYSWDICDQACSNLFHKTPFFIDKAFAYSFHPSEFVKRCGFVLMLQYALHHKKSDDNLCLQFLNRVEEEAHDDRNFVKKAVNWCLRQIGKRNTYLLEEALSCAYRIAQQPSKSARWIAADAIRELEDKKAKGVVKSKL